MRTISKLTLNIFMFFYCLINCNLELNFENICDFENNQLDFDYLKSDTKNLSNYNIVNFLKDLEVYRPNAPWIIQDLMKLSFADFENAFSTIIDIFTKPDKRWFYFNDKEEGFENDDYWYQSIWQAQFYDNWLSHLYIDLKNRKLIYKSSFVILPKGIVSFAQYVEISLNFPEQSKLSKSYYQFYAFYIDCFSYFFCQMILAAYKVMNENKLYNSYINIAKKCIEKINNLLLKIKSSRFYNMYYIALKKYREIIKLLEEEKLLGFKEEAYG